MLNKVFKNVVASLYAELKVVTFLLIISIIANCFLVFSLYMKSKKEKVFFYPVGWCGKYELSLEGKPDRTYLLAITRFVVDSLLTYSPYTADKQFASVLPLFIPEKRPSYEKTFNDLALQAKDTKMDSVFYIDDIKVHPEKHEILITGTHVYYLNNEQVENKKETYKLKYVVKYGTFRLVDFIKVGKGKEITS